MKDLNRPGNFNVTLRRETLDSVKLSAQVRGVGVYRALKDYLAVHVFHYMTSGDTIRIVTMNDATATIEVVIHLNLRLLNKAKEKVGSEGLYAATRQRGKNPLGGTEPTAAD